jgi:nucleoside-diphosphate-sugar epimerase
MGKIRRNKIRVLVTGANGFIGSSMYKFLDKKKHLLVTTSVSDLTDYKNALLATKGIDYVFHFAASMGGIGFFSKQNYYPPITNFLIDINMLRACEKNGVKRLFYPASACAYPMYLMNKGKKLEENMLNAYAKPDQMYGWEKLTMIKLIRNSPVDCRVGILHTIYGEGQEYCGERAKFPPQIAYKMLESINTGIVSVWGNGTQKRTFLHISDAIRMMYEVMMRPYHGEVNIGEDKELSVKEVVNICSNILNIKPFIRYEKDKPVGPKFRRCDSTKFKKYYKTRIKVSPEKGFTRLINYIKKHERA